MTAWTEYPQAVTGTWDDIERQAVYLYANAAEGSAERDMAEAVLVLLRAEYEARVRSWPVIGR